MRNVSGEELSLKSFAFVKACKDGTKEEFRVFNAGFFVGSDYWREFAYLLAGALADEVHFSQTPSQDSLDLLKQAKARFTDTELIQRLEEMKIDELVPVE